jgi:multidrug transporter EmrE-like cation transporter
MAWFGESSNPGRVCSLLLIIIGLIGLGLFSKASG